MRCQRLQDIVRPATRLQGSHGGLSLDDIEADFSVSRRTAERLRNSVQGVFGPLEMVDTKPSGADAKARRSTSSQTTTGTRHDTSPGAVQTAR